MTGDDPAIIASFILRNLILINKEAELIINDAKSLYIGLMFSHTDSKMTNR
jgi:hypothetical protein